MGIAKGVQVFIGAHHVVNDPGSAFRVARSGTGADYTAKGMGLTLAQRLAERFGWKVLLESQPGQGTLATLRFS